MPEPAITTPRRQRLPHLAGGIGPPPGHGAGDGIEAGVAWLGAPVAGLIVDGFFAFDDIDTCRAAETIADLIFRSEDDADDP